MYAKSCIMALLTAASFAIHGVTADRRCAIVGPGVAYCRQHPKSTAAVVKQLNIGDVYNYGCRYPYGESVNGDSGWDLNTDLNCWVWEVRTDDSCCPNCLAKCPDVCGGYKHKRCIAQE